MQFLDSYPVFWKGGVLQRRVIFAGDEGEVFQWCKECLAEVYVVKGYMLLIKLERRWCDLPESRPEGSLG